MSSLLQELRTLINEQQNEVAGRVIKVTPQLMLVSTPMGVKKYPFRPGYGVGTQVVIDPNGNLAGKKRSGANTPVYGV
jgi:hypothetical protein